jgi:hypothetical protein
MNFSSFRPSVFHCIEWPRNRVPLNRTHEKVRSSSRAKDKEVRRNERALNFQILNQSRPRIKEVTINERDSNVQIPSRSNKGKEPMGPELEFWACKQCASSGLIRTICSQSSICSICNKKGHLGLHCKAKWRPLHKRKEATLGNKAFNPKFIGAPTSNPPPPIEGMC